MGLGLYDAPFGNKFSENGSQSYPVTTTHKGNDGEVVELLLYLHNDDPTQWLNNITIMPVDINEPDDTLGDQSTGWGVKLFKGAEQPDPTKWANIKYGNTITMDNIGEEGSPDTTSFFPFWYRIVSPPGEDVKTKLDIKLRIDFTKNAV